MGRSFLSGCIVLVAVAAAFSAPAAATFGCREAADPGAPALAAGLSAHFRGWLTERDLGHWDFPRDDIPGGSYGGRRAGEDLPRNDPVVFIHGNADRAAGEADGMPQGWTAVIRHFLAQGYTPAELYATTWGPADPARSKEQAHAFAVVSRLRAFIKAVLAYSGAERVDVIGHSMGVTLARKAIQGGMLEGRDLGPSLGDRVDTLVGIAGANRGLTACFAAPTQPVCSAENGFYPGRASFLGVTGVSALLADLNAETDDEGRHVFSIWSRADQLIGYGGLVYGRYTSRIPGQDGEKVYDAPPYGHFCVRDLSAPVQIEMVRRHRVPRD